MQGALCMVRGCRYLAENELESPVGRFVACALHDAPQVVAMLARGEMPHAYWSQNRPIVLPVGPLAATPLTFGDFDRAWDDPMMAEVDDRPTLLVMEQFDLTRR